MKNKETVLRKKIDSLERVCDRTLLFSDLHRKIEHMQKCFYYVAESLKEIDRLNSSQVTEYSLQDEADQDLPKAEASQAVQAAREEERERCARLCEKIGNLHERGSGNPVSLICADRIRRGYE